MPGPWGAFHVSELRGRPPNAPTIRARRPRVLTNPPARIRLFLSEPVLAETSSVTVLDRQGNLVIEGRPSPGLQAGAIEIELPTLAEGTYSVAWQTVGAGDAHVISGYFTFTIAGAGRYLLTSLASPASAGNRTVPTPINVLTRWTEFLGVGLLAGAAVVHPIVWRRRTLSASPDRDSQLGKLRSAAGLTGASMVFAANGTEFVAGRMWLEGSILLSVPSLLSLWRVLGSVMLWGFWWTARAKLRGPILIAIAILVLLAFSRSIGSHAAGGTLGFLAGAAVDFAHYFAAALWIGGLASLLIGFAAVRRLDAADRMRSIVAAVPRFSVVAGICVVVIGVSGIVSAWLQITELVALRETPHGVGLLVKTAIAIPMLALGAVNFTVTTRSLATSVDSHSRFQAAFARARRIISTETAVGVAVILVAAFVVNLEPGRETLSERLSTSNMPVAMPAYLPRSGLSATLGLSPNRLGRNTFVLELADENGQPPEVSGEPSIRLHRLDSRVSVPEFPLKPSGQGRYVGQSKALTVVGTWVASLNVGNGEILDYVFRVALPMEQASNPVKSFWTFISGGDRDPPETASSVPGSEDSQAALEIVRSADRSMNQLSQLAECNNINGTVTRLRYAASDRLYFSVDGGVESVIKGDRQWLRSNDGEWSGRARSADFVFPDFNYAQQGVNVRYEGVHRVNDIPHHVVSLYSSRDGAEYWFWIDLRTHFLKRLVMNITPSHYMVSVFSKPAGTEEIVVPESGGQDPDYRSLIDFPERCDRYLP